VDQFVILVDLAPRGPEILLGRILSISGFRHETGYPPFGILMEEVLSANEDNAPPKESETERKEIKSSFPIPNPPGRLIRTFHYFIKGWNLPRGFAGVLLRERLGLSSMRNSEAKPPWPKDPDLEKSRSSSLLRSAPFLALIVATLDAFLRDLPFLFGGSPYARFPAHVASCWEALNSTQVDCPVLAGNTDLPPENWTTQNVAPLG
jgi:hypothetical protein